MIQLRRAGIALAAVALSLATVLNSPAANAHNDSRAAKPRVDTSTITFDNISPATIPAKGTIVVTGTLHNGSGQTWHHLSVMPQTSYRPIATSSELAGAATFDPANVTLGQELPALSASLRDLAPGASSRFTIRIPRTDLNISGDAGAYWLGVVPQSDEAHPTSLTARTFLPLLPKANKNARLNIALVVPLRESPLRTTTGALADATGFATDLSPAGRLGRIATFGLLAGTRPLTWLVDPALLDLADDTAQGTTAYAIGSDGSLLPHPTPLPTPSGAATGSAALASTPTGSPSTTPTTSGSPSATPTGPAASAAAAALAARVTAQTWLTSVTTMLPASPTYALPYADPAIGPLVATGHGNLLTTAVALSTESMSARGLQSQPALAPADGSLTESEWSALTAGQTAFIGASSSQSMVSDNRTLIVASPASQGGPGPSTQTSALDLRQRLLAEASLRIAHATPANLTVVLPAGWDPGSGSGLSTFFPQLTRPWITFTALPTLSSGTAALSRAAPRATQKQRANIKAALQLRSSTAALAHVLATTAKTSDALARHLEATALSTISYSAARTPDGYRLNATRTSAVLAALMAGIRVEGTQFVTLSGSSGVITVALHNGLNQPIRVGLRQINPERGSTVTVTPIAAITLDPGERSTLRVNLSAQRVSVQEVTLTAVTAHGVPVGTPLTFTLRSSPVGAVVWAITIAIALVLAVLVVRRVRGRLRARRAAS